MKTEARRKAIIEILRPYLWNNLEKIADAIMALPLDVPSEDEIKKMQSGMMCGDSVNCDWVDGYIDGFKKAIIEIKKRNGL